MTKDYVSLVGKKSTTPTTIDKEAVISALKTVKDPEILINIYDLGFIYGIDIDNYGNIEITMTLTAPGCPVADVLPLAAANSVLAVENVGEVRVILVWDPAWTIDRVSEEIKDLIEYF